MESERELNYLFICIVSVSFTSLSSAFLCVRENVSHLGHILKQLHNNNTETAIHIKRPLLSLAGSIQLLLSYWVYKWLGFTPFEKLPFPPQ